MMAKMDHRNVVKFYGISYDDANGDLLVVYEYMELGDLKTYLRERGTNSMGCFAVVML